MLAVLDMVNYIFDPDYYKHNSKVSLICLSQSAYKNGTTQMKHKMKKVQHEQQKTSNIIDIFSLFR